MPMRSTSLMTSRLTALCLHARLRLSSALFAVFAFGLLLACAGFAAPTQAHAETVYSSAQLLRSTDSTITLGCNIKLDSYWEIGENRNVTLDLNGYMLDRGLSEAKKWGCVIYLARDAQLAVQDGQGGGKITGGYGSNCAGGIHASCGNRIWINGGSVDGNRSSWGGGGVYIGSGSYLFLNGGSITTNKAVDCDGGGVYAGKDSKFYMYTGQLCNNSAYDNKGGGVFANKAHTYVYDGTIDGNIARRGGAFYQSTRSMNISGGTFTNNVAQDASGEQSVLTSGGAIVADEATLEVASAMFEGSKAGRGAAIALAGEAEAKITDATIQSCTSSSGAVYAEGQSSLYMSKCTLRDNKGVYASAIFVGTPTNSFESCTITGNSRVPGGTYYAAVYSGTKNFDGVLRFSGSTVIDDNDNGSDYAVLAGKIRLDSSDKVLIGDAGVCLRDGIDCANLSNAASRITVAYPTGKPWSWKDSWAFASFDSESQAQENITKFVCADSSRSVVQSGSKLYLRGAEGLRGLHTPSITKVKVSEPSSSGQGGMDPIVFEQDIKSAQDKTMSFTSDVSIDLEKLDVTIEYTDSFVNSSGNKVYRTADGGESAEPVTLVKSLTAQDFTSPRTFEVTAAGQDKAKGLTSYDSVYVSVSATPAPTTVMLKVKNFNAAGVGSWSGTMRRAGNADVTLSTASELQNNPVSGWVQSTDGGATWETAPTNVVTQADGVTSFTYHTPASAEGTVQLRPVYEVAKVVLRNALITPGSILPAQFMWVTMSSGDRSGALGLTSITWVGAKGGAVAEESKKYTAKASINLGENFVVTSGTQVVLGSPSAGSIHTDIQYPNTLNITADLVTGADRTKYRNLTIINEDDESKSVQLVRIGETVSVPAPASTAQGRTFKCWEFVSGEPSVHESVNSRTMQFSMPENDVELVARYQPAAKGVNMLAFGKPQAGQALATQLTYTIDATKEAGGDDYQEHTASLVWQPAGQGDAGTAAWNTAYTATADLDLGNAYVPDLLSSAVWDGQKEATGYNLMLTKLSDHKVRATFSFDATSSPSVASVVVPADIQVAYGTPLKRADLPRYVEVTLTNGDARNLRVRWTSSDYQSKVPGTYTVTGSLVLPDGIEAGQHDTFTIKATVVTFDPPSVSVEPGTYDSAQTIELTCSDEDVETICYSLDDSPYMVYEGPIALEGTEGESAQHTLKTYAIGKDDLTSDTKTYTYTINVPVPEYPLSVTNGTAHDESGQQISAAKVGQLVYVQADAIDGKTFKQWEAQGIELGPDQVREGVISFVMPRGNVSLTGVFSDVPVAETFAVTLDAPVAGSLLAQSAKVEVAGQAFDVPKSRITWTDAATGEAALRAEAGKMYTVSIGGFAAPAGVSVPQNAKATVNGASATLQRSSSGNEYIVTRQLTAGSEQPAADDHTVTVEHWVGGESQAAFTNSFACAGGGTAYVSATSGGRSSVEKAVFDHWEEVGAATGVVTNENRTNPLLEFTVLADVHLKAVYKPAITAVTLGIAMPEAGRQFEGAAAASYVAHGVSYDLNASQVSVRWFSNGTEATGTASWEKAYTAVAAIPLSALAGVPASEVNAYVQDARAASAYVDGDSLVVTATYQSTAARVKVTSTDQVPAVSDVAWGTEISAMQLPQTVGYMLADRTTGQATVSWDEHSADPVYDPYITHEQTFTLTGTLTFPEGVNPNGNTTTTVQVSVKAAPMLTHYEVHYSMQKEDLSGYEPGGPVVTQEDIQAYEGTTAEVYTDLEIGFDAPVITYVDSEHSEEQAGLPQIKGDGSTVVYVRYPRSTWQAAQFMGGSLRMDKYKQPDGTYTYDKTDLRFGYHITLPEGAKLVSWGWDYGSDSNNLSGHLDGRYVRYPIESDGFTDGYVSYLVITGIPSSSYRNCQHVRMTVEYETADGVQHAYVNETKDRSVEQVANAVVHSTSESVEAKEYAQNILNAIAVSEEE